MPRRPVKKPADLAQLRKQMQAKQAGKGTRKLTDVRREIADGLQKLKEDAVIENMGHQKRLQTIEQRLVQGKATATDLTNLKKLLKVYFR